MSRDLRRIVTGERSLCKTHGKSADKKHEGCAMKYFLYTSFLFLLLVSGVHAEGKGAVTLVFRPPKPSFPPVNPQFRPVNPAFKPVNPQFRPVEPKFTPVNPQFREVNPSFPPENPAFRTMKVVVLD